MLIKSKGLFDFSVFILLAFLWSGSFINIKITVDACPPFFSAMLRVFIAFLVFSLFFLYKKKPFRVPFKDAWRLWITGFFMQGLPFAFLFYGERFVEPALASIINSTCTIWVLLLGTLFFRDVSQWTVAKVSGIFIGFMGILLIFWPMLHGQPHVLIGALSVMGMAISYAIGALANQHLVFGKMKTQFETNLWQQHFASFLFLFILSFFFESWPSLHTVMQLKVLSAFLYLGVFATALSWMIYFYLIREWDAVRTTSVMYIVPVLAFTWDYFFLHLTPTWHDAIGAIAILSGVMLIQRKRSPSPACGRGSAKRG